MFILQQPRAMPWRAGDKPTPVITYYDARGERYFLIRPHGDKFDIRLIVQQTVTADRAEISIKQLETTVRTLGIGLTEPDILVLAQSTLRMAVQK